MIKLKKDIWKTAKLGEVCEINMGKTPSRNNLANFGKGYTWLSIADFKGDKYLSKSKEEITDFALTQARFKPIKQNTLLLTFKLTIGKIAIAGKELYTNEAIAALPIKNEKVITTDFLYTILQTIDYDSKTDKAVKGATLNKEKLTHLSFPLPPLEEQKQIAALFQSIETAMEQVDGQEKNLHQLKHKLLKDLFSEKQEFGNHLKAKDFETVKFAKIAINISERVEPKKTELTTYVGLEHLDADNLKIERTGTPDDVIGTKLKIYKGDIIFGKRRAYLRKVAVSHFDGIASAHSMILRANEKNIEKDFLPYFMQSDTFMSRAVQISEGSLSPTIKNKTLAVQEFILPKKEKQKELISVFKQFDTTMEQLKQQRTTLKNLKQKLLNEILG